MSSFRNLLVVSFLMITFLSLFSSPDNHPTITRKDKIRQKGYLIGCMYSESKQFRAMNGMMPNAKDRKGLVEKCTRLFQQFKLDKNTNQVRMYYAHNIK